MRLAKGISVLEAVLVVALAATIIIGTIRYYDQAKRRSAVLQATSQIQRIVQASDEWRSAQRIPDMSRYSSNIIDDLVQAQLLNKSDTNNPWGGSVSVTGDSSSGQLVVRLESIPSNSCQLLITRFRTNATEGDFVCNGKSGASTWEGRFE